MRGVFANSRKRSHLLDRKRECSAMSIYHALCGSVEVACTRVIAESLPRVEHFIFRCASERAKIWKSLQPVPIIWQHGRDLRLLQHEFGNKNPVGIASTAPRKIATVTEIPAKKRSPKRTALIFGGVDFQQTLNIQRSTSNIQFRVERWALSVERWTFSGNELVHTCTDRRAGDKTPCIARRARVRIRTEALHDLLRAEEQTERGGL